MRRLPGLWGQQLAPALPMPRSLVAIPLAGGNPYKRLGVTRPGGSLSVSSELSTIATPWFDLAPVDFKRDNLFETRWTQLSGPAGVVQTDGALRARCQHTFGGYNTYPISWRCDLADKYGRQDSLVVDFALSYVPPPLPPLSAYGNPIEMQLLAVDPGTRQVTAFFSVVVTSGVPPFSFDWGGGDNRYGSSNSTTLTLPLEATQGFNWYPGCTVTDDAGRSIVVGTGGFFIYLM